METFELLDLDDLDLNEIVVTSLRDTVQLPETAASSSCNGCGGGSGCGSCETQ